SERATPRVSGGGDLRRPGVSPRPPIRPSRGACEISRPAPAQGKNAEGAVPIGTAPSVYRMIVQILTFTALPSGVRTM
ncbi:hypothetical protein, partial [Paramuribaculum intestinale]|uniref:hypothetical protein n=1 Tax=Paramuribaculum intestinale TaxID=2094151 RepID=UPI0025A99ADA